MPDTDVWQLSFTAIFLLVFNGNLAIMVMVIENEKPGVSWLILII